MIRRPPRSTLMRSSAASDVYKRQVIAVKRAFSVPSQCEGEPNLHFGAGDTPTSAASDSGASTAAQTTAATGGSNSPATSAVATTMSTKHDSPQAESSATPITQFTFVTLMAAIISRMF
eukprot:TRINITY_DN3501_c0_g1_i2.p1 TRINITY_DN3501_c0_g1~~TRINITY_DN3501_c0_g1_i2.p1  ORF type:complete len:119 (-),score=4.02 TRINITY_DN3501_c0_g1_i2:29-385(-)